MASWTSLPVELKQEIVDYLYYTDKQSLSQCSKSDRALVAKCRWVFDRINYLINRDSKKGLEVEHRYRMDVFDEEGTGTMVEKRFRQEYETSPRWTYEPGEFFENRDWQEMASDRLNEIFKAQNYRIDDLKIDLASKIPVFNRTVYAKTVQITVEMRRFNASDLFKMVDSFHPSVDWLQFTIGYEIPHGMGSLETVKKAQRLVFSGFSGLNDKDLLGLEATFLDIGTSEITRNGIRDFIHKRYNLELECSFSIETQGEGRIEDGFETCEPYGREDVRVLYCPMKWKLTKPGSKMTFYVRDLENTMVDGCVKRNSE